MRHRCRSARVLVLQLFRCTMPKPPAIVLSSGGLHSLIVAGLAARENRIAMLHLKDGRPTARQAHAAFQAQAAHFKPIKIWELDGAILNAMRLPPEIAGTITSTSSDPHAALLPFRELQMLIVAAGFARQIRAASIFWGVQFDQKATDALARNIELVQMVNQLLELYGGDPVVSVRTPLMGLEDNQVIELGYQLGVPFAASWTCQTDMDSPCQSCPACTRRSRSFRGAQLADPALAKK